MLINTGLVTIDGAGQSKEIKLLSQQHQIALEAFKSNATKLLERNSPLRLENFERLYCDQFTLGFEQLCQKTLWDRVKQIPKLKLTGKDKKMLSLKNNNESQTQQTPQEGRSERGDTSTRIVISGESSVVQNQATPCYYFHQRGRCRFGQNCKNTH